MREVLTEMLERHALAINCIVLAITALALIRPSSGTRMIVLVLLLAAAALIGMEFGIRNLLRELI